MATASRIPFIWDHPYRQLEFDWLATDLDGHLGLLSTAGEGPVPQVVLAMAGELEEPWDLVEGLEEAGGFEQLSHFDAVADEWLDYAARGVFAFDRQWNSRSYEVIARPGRPLAVNELSDGPLKRSVSLVRFPFRFANTERIVGLRDQGTVMAAGPEEPQG